MPRESQETPAPPHDLYRRDVEAHIEAVRSFFHRQAASLARAASEMAAALRAGSKILLFGNGGSAADAQHLAAELVNRMGRDRPAVAALALTTDTSILTSIANDSSYERIFARQIEALGRKGDLAFALSTSGDSPNIVSGLQRARESGLRTLGLLGRDGGKARKLCDHALVVESDDTARIQEVHILVGHLICAEVEALLFAPPKRAGR
jgi:D-sedoheptulose 7-phosphate isomerase